MSRNPCVSRCSGKTIIYTYDFKKRALELHAQGISAKEIWRRAGFDLGMWRQDYPRECIKDWRKLVKEHGFEGLTRMQGVGATGRPRTRGVTDKDRIKRLELQVKYLEAENDFLTQLRARRAESNSGHNKNSRSSDK